MAIQRPFEYRTFIIPCLLSFFIVFFLPFASYAQAQEEVEPATASTFAELTSLLSRMQVTGGVIALTEDITVPASESFTYINARYRKEIAIETSGHTIYVEGYLELWPFLTIRGNGGPKALFHVYPGGELRLFSICLNAGENGMAVVQDEGAFLVCGSEEDMGLPAFSCTGQILSAQTMTAAAYWRYSCEKLPIVRIPEGANFTADMLPDQVLSIVNREYQEYEEEAPVVWDEATFPSEQERTLVQGRFAHGYSQYEDYIPQCLVIWESDTSPFFLNVYRESVTQRYDMIFMYGESPQPGTIYIQASEDGENWADIAGTEGYAPVEAEENADFSWILSYDVSEPTQERPRYYRLLQILDDGTELYSDVLELNDEFIFTAADIEGGRGGEVSPNEGENQLTNGIQKPENGNGTSSPESWGPSTGRPLDPESTQLSSEPDIGVEDSERPKDETAESEDHGGVGNTEENSNLHAPGLTGSTTWPGNTSTALQPEASEETMQGPDLTEDLQPVKADREPADDTSGMERVIGIGIVIGILLSCVALSVFKRRG